MPVDAHMAIAFNMFVLIMWLWIAGCFLLLVWSMAGWLYCVTREWRRDREQTIKLKAVLQRRTEHRLDHTPSSVYTVDEREIDDDV